jgi:hypothetical protein
MNIHSIHAQNEYLKIKFSVPSFFTVLTIKQNPTSQGRAGIFPVNEVLMFGIEFQKVYSKRSSGCLIFFSAERKFPLLFLCKSYTVYQLS